MMIATKTMRAAALGLSALMLGSTQGPMLVSAVTVEDADADATTTMLRGAARSILRAAGSGALELAGSGEVTHERVLANQDGYETYPIAAGGGVDKTWGAIISRITWCTLLLMWGSGIVVEEMPEGPKNNSKKGVMKCICGLCGWIARFLCGVVTVLKKSIYHPASAMSVGMFWLGIAELVYSIECFTSPGSMKTATENITMSVGGGFFLLSSANVVLDQFGGSKRQILKAIGMMKWLVRLIIGVVIVGGTALSIVKGWYYNSTVQILSDNGIRLLFYIILFCAEKGKNLAMKVCCISCGGCCHPKCLGIIGLIIESLGIYIRYAYGTKCHGSWMTHEDGTNEWIAPTGLTYGEGGEVTGCGMFPRAFSDTAFLNTLGAISVPFIMRYGVLAATGELKASDTKYKPVSTGKISKSLSNVTGKK